MLISTDSSQAQLAVPRLGRVSVFDPLRTLVSDRVGVPRCGASARVRVHLDTDAGLHGIHLVSDFAQVRIIFPKKRLRFNRMRCASYNACVREPGT